MPLMKVVLIPCPRCKGGGQVRLPEELRQVLASVKGGCRTAEKILANIGALVTVNAISNRLAELLELGFVARHREGKFWHYMVTKR